MNIPANADADAMNPFLDAEESKLLRSHTFTDIMWIVLFLSPFII